jgi:hypothetical protein
MHLHNRFAFDGERPVHSQMAAIDFLSWTLQMGAATVSVSTGFAENKLQV